MRAAVATGPGLLCAVSVGYSIIMACLQSRPRSVVARWHEHYYWRWIVRSMVAAQNLNRQLRGYGDGLTIKLVAES